MKEVVLEFNDLLHMDADYEEMLETFEDIVKKQFPDAEVEIETVSIDKDNSYVGDSNEEELDENFFDSDDNPVDVSGNSRYSVTLKIKISADGVQFKLKDIKAEMLEYSAPTGKFVE